MDKFLVLEGKKLLVQKWEKGLRLVQVKPSFKHYSTLFPLSLKDQMVYLFDDFKRKRYYLWHDIDDPEGFTEISYDDHIKLRSLYHKQNRKNKKRVVK